MKLIVGSKVFIGSMGRNNGQWVIDNIVKTNSFPRLQYNLKRIDNMPNSVNKIQLNDVNIKNVVSYVLWFKFIMKEVWKLGIVYNKVDNEEELLLENEKLIWHIINNKINIVDIKVKTGYEIDDIYNVAMIGLLKAIRTYNSKSYQFSTYAATCIMNEIFEISKKYNSQKRKAELLSLDKNYNENDEDAENCINLYNVTGYTDVGFDYVECKDALKYYVNRLGKTDGEIFLRLINKEKHREIAIKMGISKSLVSRRYNLFKGKLLHMFNSWISLSKTLIL